jgi:hypothetical protein
MGRDQDRNEQFEWVNAWVESGHAAFVRAEPTITPLAEIPNVSPASPGPVIAPVARALPDDQLMRDVVEIERARDAIAVMPVGSFSVRRRTQALALVPSRTTDPVPVVIGGVLALVMLMVFGAAAAMTKLSR